MSILLGTNTTSILPVRASAHGDEPFVRVKGSINEMEAGRQGVFGCYPQGLMWQSALSSSIDTKTAQSAQPKREDAELQISLGQLAASYAAVTKLRAEEEAKGGLAVSP